MTCFRANSWSSNLNNFPSIVFGALSQKGLVTYYFVLFWDNAPNRRSQKEARGRQTKVKLKVEIGWNEIVFWWKYLLQIKEIWNPQTVWDRKRLEIFVWKKNNQASWREAKTIQNCNLVVLWCCKLDFSQKKPFI